MFYRSKSKNINFLKLYRISACVFNKISLIKRRRKNRLIFKVLAWIFVVFFIVIIVASAINFFNIKIIYSKAVTGKENIDYAQITKPQSNYDRGNVFFENLLKQNTLVYLYDKEKQEIILEQNYGGAISGIKSDYVFVVDANLTTFEIDSTVNRGIEYKINQDVNGVFAELTVNYKHNGAGFDGKIAEYHAYTRIYTPPNSSLISVKGFNDDELKIYNEFGKTVFAGFISVESGEFCQIKLRYKLNDDIFQHIKNNGYSLIFQKQPGSKVESLRVGLNFNNKIKLYNPVGFYADSAKNSVSWDSGLEADRVFWVELER